MAKLTLKLIGAFAVAGFAITACATPNTAPEVVSVAESTAAAEPTATAETAPVTKAEPTPVAEKTEAKDPNRRICKRQKVPGSNLKKKVCASAARWAEEEERAREFLEGVQKNNRSRGSGN